MANSNAGENGLEYWEHRNMVAIQSDLVVMGKLVYLGKRSQAAM